jgi:hypothetical protein
LIFARWKKLTIFLVELRKGICEITYQSMPQLVLRIGLQNAPSKQTSYPSIQIQVEMSKLQNTAFGYNLIPCIKVILCSLSVAFLAFLMTLFMVFVCSSSSLVGKCSTSLPILSVFVVGSILSCVRDSMGEERMGNEIFARSEVQQKHPRGAIAPLYNFRHRHRLPLPFPSLPGIELFHGSLRYPT